MVVILIRLTRRSLGLFAEPVMQLSGIFTPYFSAQATESLPRYWDVHQKKLIRLSSALWLDTKVSNILNRWSYHPMPSAVGSVDLTVELLGYLGTPLVPGDI